MRNGKLTTQQRQQIIAEYIGGDGCSILSKRYGVHENSILKLLKVSGTPIRPRRFISKAEDARIIELYQDNWSMQEICDELGISGVHGRLKKNGIESRTPEEAHRKFALRENFFDVIDAEEKAYFLGFMFADGCNQMMHHYNACLALEISDKEVLDKLGRCRIHAYLRIPS